LTVRRFQLFAVLALLSAAALGFGCSEEEMIKPEPPVESKWDETAESLDGIILSMKFNSNQDLYLLNESNRRALTYSTDGGNSWYFTDSVRIDTLLYNIRSFTFDSVDDLWVGTDRGLLFHSSDAGASLSFVDTLGIEKFTDIRAMRINQDDDIFAAVYGAGVYRSVDGGQTWINVGPPYENKSFVKYGMEIGPGGVIYVSCWGGEVYKSEDNGDSWTQLNKLVTNYQTIQCVAVLEDSTLIGGYDGGFCYYDSNSEEWIKKNDGFPDLGADLRGLGLDGTGNLYAGTYGDGVYMSSVGEYSWVDISAGLPSKEVTALVMDPGGGAVVAVYNQGIYFSR